MTPAPQARAQVLDRIAADTFLPEVYEQGEYRAIITFKRPYCDAFHWDVQHWGRANGSTANGQTWRYASLEAARAFARGWISRAFFAAKMGRAVA
jgi:hypothetical protein